MTWLPDLLVFCGLALLAGGALFRRAVGPELGVARRWLTLGALLVAGSGLLVVASTTVSLLGEFTLPDFFSLLTDSVTGLAVLASAAFSLALLAFELTRARVWWPPAVAAAGLLVALALPGHAREGGPWTSALHALHLIAMTAWVGAVVFLAWQPSRAWTDGHAVRSTLKRVSTVGLASVLVLCVTGALTATLHVPGVGAVTGSYYGRTLLWKLGVVLVVLAAAALNRFVFLPRGVTNGLRTALRAESVLLAVVLGLSAALSVTPLPVRPITEPANTPFDLRFGPARVRGSIDYDGRGGLLATLRVQGSDARPNLTLDMTDHTMPTVRFDLRAEGDELAGEGRLWMLGTWIASVTLNGETRQVPLRMR